MEKRSGNKTRLTPHRKGWREELKGKHSYASSRRKCDLLKKAGNCRVHSWFMLLPQQILGEQNPDELLNKRGEENVKCISVFSEALYYSSKLLFCVRGVPTHICFVDPGNSKKPK